jgi:hypothetical protein
VVFAFLPVVSTVKTSGFGFLPVVAAVETTGFRIFASGFGRRNQWIPDLCQWFQPLKPVDSKTAANPARAEGANPAAARKTGAADSRRAPVALIDADLNA